MGQHRKQESPPAWTQEAYRPPRSKCSLCCSVGGGGGDPSRGQGGYPILTWLGKYSSPILTGGIPSWPGWRIPQSWLEGTPSWPGWGGYPILGYPNRTGVLLWPGLVNPPGKDLGSVTWERTGTRLPLERTWYQWLGKELVTGVPLESTWYQWRGKGHGTGVLPRCEQTDTHENSTFHILRMRAVITILIFGVERKSGFSCTKGDYEIFL